MASWKVYLLSDLHLEINGGLYVNKHLERLYTQQISANDVLVLAGDIFHPDVKTYDKFFSQISIKFKTVFYLFGNHEYYSKGSTYLDIKERIRLILRNYPNITILDNKTSWHQGIKFVGTTLWSQITTNRLLAEKECNDYKAIYTRRSKRLTVDDVNLWNDINVSWLEKEIQTGPCIVLTHHAPLFNTEDFIVSDSPNTHLEEIYHNDLTFLFNDNIVAWCYGHTHYATSFIFDNICFFSNPLGYTAEKTGFDPSKSLTVATQTP